jgi:hypothetical protein
LTSPLRITFEVGCAASHAFDLWTTRIGTWWPPDHTVSGQRGAQVVLEGGVGGRIFERTDDGAEHDWGEVTTWEPPVRLGYLWHLGADRSRATDVDIRFVAVGPRETRIEVEHRGWERLGGQGDTWRDRNRIGWETLLPHFAAAVERGDDRMATGTKDDPWILRTPPGTSEYSIYEDREADPPALVCQVGTTTLRYHLRAVDDLHTWLIEQGDWVPLGAADEKKPAADGTVEAWGRSDDNPVGGWYGLRNGYRGRFGMYVPPLLEELGLAELTHDARNNRVRAIDPEGGGR